MRFIGFTIPPEDVRRAREEIEGWSGKCCDNYYGHDWRVRGILAEQLFGRRYPGAVRVQGLPSHDFILGQRFIEIKSRQITKFPHWDNIVGVLEEDVPRIHPAALLVFVIIKANWTTGWLAGWMAMPDFLRIARLKPSGSPSGVVTYKYANREVAVSELELMKDLPTTKGTNNE